MTPAILVVDDSLTVRMDLVDAFEHAGLRVIACASIADARRALATESIGLAVLDVVLPDGDGLDLLAEIRASGADDAPFVLLLSTEAEVEDRIRGLRGGADEYVGKPYDASYVVARARELLESRRVASDRRVIVAIDDSPTAREVLREALESAGYAVITAASGEEGLRIAASRRPDAIVVDGSMPGIDGATVIRRVRLDPALRNTPCLMLTGSDGPQAELAALDAGADAFARKEEEIDLLLARVAAMLRTRPDGRDQGSASALGAKKILAVDDSPTYLDELARSLRSEGYDIVLARSGEEALDLLVVQPVDCILLDLVMPGLDGRETCRRVKSSPPFRDTPLILLTAVEDHQSMIDGLAAGADDYVSKSSDFEVLRARVRAQIRRKHTESEVRRVREQLLQKELEAAEARAARDLAAARAALVEHLERQNRELEAFSYSVSHDLRGPLRTIDGFSNALLEDYAGGLDERAVGYLRRVRNAAQRMGELIEDLMSLSRLTRAEIVRTDVDLSEVAREILSELASAEPTRVVDVHVEDGIVVHGDRRLMRVALENLLGNAWKFTARNARAHIEVGRAGDEVYVRDDGVGFDMQYAEGLFRPFRRLHADHEFQGTGIGLATVHRIVERHGGDLRATSTVGVGTTIYMRLPRSTSARTLAPEPRRSR